MLLPREMKAVNEQRYVPRPWGEDSAPFSVFLPKITYPSMPPSSKSQQAFIVEIEELFLKVWWRHKGLLGAPTVLAKSLWD